MKTAIPIGKNHELRWVYGKVEEAGKNMETKVTGSGGGGATFGGYGGNAPVRIQSHTVVHDQIFLTDENGREHSFQLKEMNVACRSGNELSVIEAVKIGKTTGHYVVVYNHTTNQVFSHKGQLNRVFRRNGWLVLAAMVACVFLGNFLSILYFGIILLPILWIWESTREVKRFLSETDFTQFK